MSSRNSGLSPQSFLPHVPILIFIHCISIRFNGKGVCSLKIFISDRFRCSPRHFPDLNLDENNLRESLDHIKLHPELKTMTLRVQGFGKRCWSA